MSKALATFIIGRLAFLFSFISFLLMPSTLSKRKIFSLLSINKYHSLHIKKEFASIKNGKATCIRGNWLTYSNAALYTFHFHFADGLPLY